LAEDFPVEHCSTNDWWQADHSRIWWTVPDTAVIGVLPATVESVRDTCHSYERVIKLDKGKSSVNLKRDNAEYNINAAFKGSDESDQ
jgi:hypothetical protein